MRKLFCLLLLLLPLLTCKGERVTAEQAQSVALHYADQVKAKSSRIVLSAPIVQAFPPKQVSVSKQAYMWLVATPIGWALVSSSTKTVPVLAVFDDLEEPNFDQFPPAAFDLLSSYEQAIVYAEDSCIDCPPHRGWEFAQVASPAYVVSSNVVSIEPLLKRNNGQEVSWNQIGPGSDCNRIYNKFCPAVNAPSQCNKAAVGCVAVAIAQIMWYWQWPYAANVPTTVGGNTFDMRFYDWDKLPTRIEGAPMDEVDNIAGFLRDCGYQIGMNYGASSSATISQAKNALIAFGYDRDKIEERTRALTPSFEGKIIAELQAGRPVYMRGRTTGANSEGHAFVVDGCQTDGVDVTRFHINMGWGGYGTGEWVLSAGYEKSVEFTRSQAAIMGIRPAPFCHSTTFAGNGSAPKFSVVSGGEVVLNGVVSNVTQGQIISGTQVRLTNGAEIRQGSQVHLAIRDVPCPVSSQEIQGRIEPEQESAPRQAPVYSERNNSVSIVPNPAKYQTTINIRSGAAQRVVLSVTDMLGMCVQTQTIFQDIAPGEYQYNLSVQDLIAGVYIVSVWIDNEAYVNKLIVQ